MKVGDRIRLIRTTDRYTNLEPGALGTVRLIDSVGTLHVDWDNGSLLGLVPGHDQFESAPVMSEPAEREHFNGEPVPANPLIPQVDVRLDITYEQSRLLWCLVMGEPLTEAEVCEAAEIRWAIEFAQSEAVR